MHSSATRIWLVPLSIVGGVCLAVFVLSYLVDASSSADPAHVLRLIFHPNPAAAAQTLANAAGIAAAVLAIALTVVAIVVELASNRYTHRVTELFISEPLNFFVMGLFVVTALHATWVSMIFDQDPAGGGFVPYTGFGVTMLLLTLCLLVLLPYFNFVFAYLNPIQIVRRIYEHTLRAIERGGRDMRAVQAEAVRGVDQLGDVALNAMQSRDKGVSMAAVDALRDLVRDYQATRATLADSWYLVDGELANNPDFVSMNRDVLSQVSSRRIWFEMKVLRQYQMVFGDALGRISDLSCLIAINTRLLAEQAAAHDQVELLKLSIKFFNTYLRAAINAEDVRSAYSVIHQYRLLAQALIGYQDGRYALDIARHFSYYGHVSVGADLPFILETVAYDLCALNEVAHASRMPVADELLEIFLRVDKETEADGAHDASLRGVRKAQVKLATYYLLEGDEARARKIYSDMAHEEPQRMASIRDELMQVESPEYWEVIDRGVNFDYLPPDRKAKLEQFFGWFPPLPTART